MYFIKLQISFTLVLLLISVVSTYNNGPARHAKCPDGSFSRVRCRPGHKDCYTGYQCHLHSEKLFFHPTFRGVCCPVIPMRPKCPVGPFHGPYCSHHTHCAQGYVCYHGACCLATKQVCPVGSIPGRPCSLRFPCQRGSGCFKGSCCTMPAASPVVTCPGRHRLLPGFTCDVRLACPGRAICRQSHCCQPMATRVHAQPPLKFPIIPPKFIPKPVNVVLKIPPNPKYPPIEIVTAKPIVPSFKRLPTIPIPPQLHVFQQPVTNPHNAYIPKHEQATLPTIRDTSTVQFLQHLIPNPTRQPTITSRPVSRKLQINDFVQNPSIPALPIILWKPIPTAPPLREFSPKPYIPTTKNLAPKPEIILSNRSITPRTPLNPRRYTIPSVKLTSPSTAQLPLPTPLSIPQPVDWFPIPKLFIKPQILFRPIIPSDRNNPLAPYITHQPPTFKRVIPPPSRVTPPTFTPVTMPPLHVTPPTFPPVTMPPLHVTPPTFPPVTMPPLHVTPPTFPPVTMPPLHVTPPTFPPVTLPMPHLTPPTTLPETPPPAPLPHTKADVTCGTGMYTVPGVRCSAMESCPGYSQCIHGVCCVFTVIIPAQAPTTIHEICPDGYLQQHSTTCSHFRPCPEPARCILGVCCSPLRVPATHQPTPPSNYVPTTPLSNHIPATPPPSNHIPATPPPSTHIPATPPPSNHVPAATPPWPPKVSLEFFMLTTPSPPKPVPVPPLPIIPLPPATPPPTLPPRPTTPPHQESTPLLDLPWPPPLPLPTPKQPPPISIPYMPITTPPLSPWKQPPTTFFPWPLPTSTAPPVFSRCPDWYTIAPQGECDMFGECSGTSRCIDGLCCFLLAPPPIIPARLLSVCPSDHKYLPDASCIGFNVCPPHSVCVSGLCCLPPSQPGVVTRLTSPVTAPYDIQACPNDESRIPDAYCNSVALCPGSSRCVSGICCRLPAPPEIVPRTRDLCPVSHYQISGFTCNRQSPCPIGSKCVAGICCQSIYLLNLPPLGHIPKVERNTVTPVIITVPEPPATVTMPTIVMHMVTEPVQTTTRSRIPSTTHVTMTSQQNQSMTIPNLSLFEPILRATMPPVDISPDIIYITPPSLPATMPPIYVIRHNKLHSQPMTHPPTTEPPIIDINPPSIFASQPQTYTTPPTSSNYPPTLNSRNKYIITSTLSTKINHKYITTPTLSKKYHTSNTNDEVRSITPPTMETYTTPWTAHHQYQDITITPPTPYTTPMANDDSRWACPGGMIRLGDITCDTPLQCPDNSQCYSGVCCADNLPKPPTCPQSETTLQTPCSDTLQPSSCHVSQECDPLYTCCVDHCGRNVCLFLWAPIDSKPV